MRLWFHTFKAAVKNKNCPDVIFKSQQASPHPPMSYSFNGHAHIQPFKIINAKQKNLLMYCMFDLGKIN